MTKYQQGKRTVYNIGYHIIWVPKYRKSILTGHFKSIVEKALKDKSKELNIILEKYEIMPDHIHIFIKCKPTHCISNIVKHLKGYSSYILRLTYPRYRKYKALWTPSYYCESVGHISEQTVKRYIDDQWIVAKKNGKYNSDHKYVQFIP